MAKLDDLIQQKQQRDEDWKAKKTAEREELGQLSDDAVMHVTSEPGAYLHYLDTQAINPRYSASNVMLAMAQNPEITYINSLEVWNRLGRSVNRDTRIFMPFSSRLTLRPSRFHTSRLLM